MIYELTHGRIAPFPTDDVLIVTEIAVVPATDCRMVVLDTETGEFRACGKVPAGPGRPLCSEHDY